MLFCNWNFACIIRIGVCNWCVTGIDSVIGPVSAPDAYSSIRASLWAVADAGFFISLCGIFHFPWHELIETAIQGN